MENTQAFKMKLFTNAKSKWPLPSQENPEEEREFRNETEGLAMHTEEEGFTLLDPFPDELESEEDFCEEETEPEPFQADEEVGEEGVSETTAPIIRMGRHTPLTREEEVRLFSLKSQLEKDLDELAQQMAQQLNRPKMHSAYLRKSPGSLESDKSKPRSSRTKSAMDGPFTDKAERDLSRKSLHELAEKIIACRNQLREVKEAIVRSNLRLVLYIARSYVGLGLPFGDLVQEGSIGLMRAVDKFDHTKGHRFSTYSVWWIRQSIRRSLSDQARTIRIPSYIQESIGRIWAETSKFIQEKGRRPNPSEMAEKLDKPVETVRKAMQVAKDAVSLDIPVGEGDSPLRDLVQDPTSISPLDGILQSNLSHRVEEILTTLSPREEMVIRLRYGIGEPKEHTLEEIGRCLHVSRERARQIESNALRKLRHPSRIQKLRDLI